MTGKSLIHSILLMALVFAFQLGVPEAAAGQPVPAPPPPNACLTDPRFVRVLGVYPDAPWQGQTVCQFTGTGFGDPQTTAYCLSRGFRVATIDGYPYCAWNSVKYITGVIISDPGSPVPPDHILYPIPQASSEARDSTGAFTHPNHCTYDPRFVQTLGLYRKVTVCVWAGSGIGNPLPEAGCAGTNNPNGRVRIFPDDFTNPPAPTSSNPAGTRYCVVTSGAFWEARGQLAVIMAQQPSHFDLGVDAHFARPLPPTGSPALLRIWISAAQTIPAGELVVRGSLMLPNSFSSWTVQTQGWACTGDWTDFSCRKTLTAPLTAPEVLVLGTTYPPSASGQSFNYSAAVTLTNNSDPVPANQSMTVTTTLF